MVKGKLYLIILKAKIEEVIKYSRLKIIMRLYINKNHHKKIIILFFKLTKPFLKISLMPGINAKFLLNKEGNIML